MKGERNTWKAHKNQINLIINLKGDKVRCEIFLEKSVKYVRSLKRLLVNLKPLRGEFFVPVFQTQSFSTFSHFSLSLFIIPKLTTQNRCFSNSIFTIVSMHRIWITDMTGSFVSHSVTEKLGLVFSSLFHADIMEGSQFAFLFRKLQFKWLLSQHSLLLKHQLDQEMCIY